MSDTPNLLAAALWYAKHGYFVFPLTPGTKIPIAGSGVYAGTTNIVQIRRWWSDNPTYNIGIHCGPSGLLVVDGDTYKTGAGSLDLPDTVKAFTAHGGTHLWYRMPAGKRYGNHRGTLPKWLDIRGYGGYVVAPPSVFIEDGLELPYTFAPGYKPSDIDPAPLPAELAIVLDAAQAGVAAAVHFAQGNVDKPDLLIWDLSAEILNLIGTGAPKGERSEADYRVILALARVGATDDEIRAVFVHSQIGEKFREKGASGNKYLAYSIGKARTWLEDHPPNARVPMDQLIAARQWVRGPQCLDRLRAAGVRRVADLVPILDALLELAIARRTIRIVTTVRALADLCALAKSSAQRRLLKVAAHEVGLLTLQPDQYGTLIDLAPLLDAAKHNEVDPSGTLSSINNNVGRVPLRSSSEDDFFADHRIDEAFTSYPRCYAIKRRGLPEDVELNPGLTSSGLVLWAALAEGGTIKELAKASGITESSVRLTLKRYERSELLFVWKEGRANHYELHPNFEERLDEARPHMTTYGIGQLRAARNANDRASYAQHKLQGRMPLEPRERARLQLRRDQADSKAAAYYAALRGMGINPHAKVRHRPPRHHIRIDHGEEWVSIHRPLYEQWQELDPMPYAERYRMLGMAGYTQREINEARRIGAKMVRGPRVFVGVGNPAQAVAA